MKRVSRIKRACSCLVMLIYIFSLCTQVFGQTSETDIKIRYLDSLFDEVSIQKDIEYKQAINYYGENEKLLLDVYSPIGDSEKNRPAIIFVHEGGLSEGSKDDDYLQKYLAVEFAKKGYVAVRINYRLNPDPYNNFNRAMKDAMEDTASSIEWLVENSIKYGVDKNRISLCGYSAGSEIITNLCYTDFVSGWDRDDVFALIDVSGNTLFYGDALKDSPPCLIIHGTADDVNPYSASENLMEKLNASGIDCELKPLEGLGHLFGYDDYLNIHQLMTDYLYKKLLPKKGDLDGNNEVDAIDFSLLKQYLLRIITEFPSVNGIKAADMDGDGAVNAIDFALLKQYLLRN